MLCSSWEEEWKRRRGEEGKKGRRVGEGGTQQHMKGRAQRGRHRRDGRAEAESSDRQQRRKSRGWKLEAGANAVVEMLDSKWRAKELRVASGHHFNPTQPSTTPTLYNPNPNRRILCVLAHPSLRPRGHWTGDELCVPTVLPIQLLTRQISRSLHLVPYLAAELARCRVRLPSSPSPSPRSLQSRIR
jgi:hypothetical protein